MKNYYILAADSNPNTLKDLESYLSELSIEYHLVTTTSEKSCFDIAKKLKPDLILLDCEIAKTNLKRLKSNEKTALIPVVVLSEDSKNYLETAFNEGASDFIRKPIDKTELLIRINNLKLVRESYQQIIEQNHVFKQQNEEIQTINNQLLEQKEELSQKNEQLLNAYKNIELLGELTQKITSSLVLENIVKIVYQYLSKFMEISFFAIGKVRRLNPKHLEMLICTDLDSEVTSTSLSIDDTSRLSMWSVRNQKELFLNDVENEIQLYLEKTEVYTSPNSFKSVIYIPLFVEKKIIGVLSVKSYQKNAFSTLHLNILKNMAAQISVAIYNAQIFRLLQIQNDNIKASINYGLTIQKSILPTKQKMDWYHETFIMYRPKDIVSGDLYWFSDKLLVGRTILALIDCTGHGVPGAFMSMVANMLLNDIVNEKKIFTPNKIFEFLDSQLETALQQNSNENNDGMDIGLCLMEKGTHTTTVTFCGAKIPLFYYDIEKSQIFELKADRRSIGESYLRNRITYTNQSITLKKGSMLYMASDGLTDQHSADRKRFGKQHFIDVLHHIARLPISEQKNALDNELNRHIQNEDQRDDITVIGIKL